MAVLKRHAGFFSLVCAGAILFGSAITHAQREATVENEVKAAFLFNFAKYVDWPPTAFTSDTSFRLCVLADSVFQKSVDAIVSGESINGRPVTRVVPENAEVARSCQILFVSRAEMERAQRLLTAVQGAPVLTVGDAPDFLDRGGTIAFIREGDRIRFDVNVVGAQRSGLSVSSRLLRVARRVASSA